MKTNRIPFSLEKYQSGKYKVITRDGRSVRIICTDFKSSYNKPIIAIISVSNEEGLFTSFRLDGSRFNSEYITEDDLFLEEVIFEDGDVVSFGYSGIGILKEINNESTHSNYITLEEGTLDDMPDGWTNDKIRMATEEECKRLFDALKKDGKRWNADKKCFEDIKEEYQFKPFDRVLVRDNNSAKWRIDIFSNLSRMLPTYPYLCVGGEWKQCIPYEGNEKLLGTNTFK